CLKQLLINLLKSPAAVRAYFMQNNVGLTALDLAQRRGHEEIVKILKNYQAEVEQIRHDLFSRLPSNPGIMECKLFGQALHISISSINCDNSSYHNNHVASEP